MDKAADNSSQEDSKLVSRRRWKTGSAALAAALTATSELAAQENLQQVRQAQHGESASNPGPDNEPIAPYTPTQTSAPMDQGNPPNFWSTFSAQHRRIQPGGWARQVRVREFPISTTIAGVNMRLTPGGVREIHWPATAEWANMLTGKARITNMHDHGRMFVADVGVGDLRFFPQGNHLVTQDVPVIPA